MCFSNKILTLPPFLNNTEIKMNKNHYESVIILTPVLSEKQMNDALDSFRQLITENGGEMVHEENWGLTKLAYPIQKKSTGFYHIFEFKAPGDLVKKLELAYRRDEQVLRFLTTKLDKHGVEFNVRRRRGDFEKKEAKPVPVIIDTPKIPVEKLVEIESDEEE